MTRIAVITDIHANVLALEAVIQDVKSQGADAVAFLGDLVMVGPRPAETLDLMLDLNPDIWILGNTDDWPSEVDENFEPANANEERVRAWTLWASDRLPGGWYSKLSSRPVFEASDFEARRLGFCHGDPESYSRGILPDLSDTGLDDLKRTSSGVEMLFAGHTHMCFIIHRESFSAVNFGSLSMPGDNVSQDARYGIIEVTERSINLLHRNVAYDFDSYIRDVEELNLPYRASLLAKYGI